MSSLRSGPRVSPGFVLLLAAFALVGEGRLLAALLAAATLHELGHYGALRACGAAVTGLRVTAFGARMETTGRAALSYGRELFSVLAGPAVNGVCAAALAVLTPRLEWQGGYLYTGAHVVLGCFNLLPILPLDGGRAMGLALAFFLGPEAGERAAAAVSLAALGLLAAGALWVVRESGGNGWLLLGVAGLAGSCGREVRRAL